MYILPRLRGKRFRQKDFSTGGGLYAKQIKVCSLSPVGGGSATKEKFFLLGVELACGGSASSKKIFQTGVDPYANPHKD